MNIEESIIILKNIKKLVDIEWKHYVTDAELSAIETLLTAYEKEKGENVKLRLQDIPLIEGELKAYKDRVNELKQELEKEKEKNKELEQLNFKYTVEIASLKTDVQEIEKENKKLNILRLELLISQFPDTTETYKKYKKELDELIKEE